MDADQLAVSPYEQARRSVEALGPADRMRLISEIAIGEIAMKPGGQPDSEAGRSLCEIQGLGKSVWQRIDVDEYLREERASWTG